MINKLVSFTLFFLFYFNHKLMTIGASPILCEKDHHIIRILFRDEESANLGPTLR